MKTTYIIIALAAIFGLFFLVPKSTSPTKEVRMNLDPTTFEKVSATKAVIETDKGTIEVVLYPEDAPKAVTNFATLAKNGYYNGLTFHRVVNDSIFIIQGGDPTGTGAGGESVYGEKFEDELNPDTASYKEGYAEGVLAMANAGPNTNGSQFFINSGDNTQSFAKAYTIFGKVTDGMDVVKKIVMGDVIKTISVQ